MKKILIINGSYRKGGISDQVIHIMTQTLQVAGAKIETVNLREYPIAFCLNCRECTQEEGEAPGLCVQHDGMKALIDKIEKADAYILASPTNFGTVTALFKRFMERLVIYGYWPWDMPAPKGRKKNTIKKPAILVSSCAAPGIIGHLFFNSTKQLKMTAKTIGAYAVGTLFTGFVSKEPHPKLSSKVQTKAKLLATKLMK